MKSARPAPTVLENIQAIEPGWIDQVLAFAGLHAAPVTAIQFEPVGHGTSSTVARLSLSYADQPGSDRLNEGPRTLIAKFPKVSANGEAPDAALLGYEREVAAYDFFGVTPPCPMPKCYFADIRADGVFNLVLEELGEGCWPGDQIAGCSIAEAGAVTETLAALHGAYAPAAVAGLSWPKRRQHLADQSARMFARGAIVMRERYADALGAAALATIDQVAPLAGPWSAKTPTAESLIHTDARVDNIIFRRTRFENDSAPGVQACLIDLQSMAIGDPAHDLAYFLTGSLDPADRAMCERELVAKHAAALQRAGTGSSSVSAWENYRQHAIAGMVATVSAASILPASLPIDRLLVALARRNCAAVQELDGVAAAQRRIAGN